MRRHAAILAAMLAWLTSIETAEAKLDILVDKATQRILVIQNGYMRYLWPVSTGRDEMATPSGVYAPQRLERNWFSSTYYNSPMPHSIFFHNGYAIHGSSAINQLGGPASHGCVRLHPQHAARLFDLVQQEGPDNTTIEVTDTALPDEPSLPARESATGQSLSPPVPRIVRYREAADMPEQIPPQRGNRSIAPRSVMPTSVMPTSVMPASVMPARPSRARRRMLTGATKPKFAEGSLPPQAQAQAQAQAPQPQQTPSVYGFKLLPTSCWSGGASRWRWWASSQGTSCN